MGGCRRRSLSPPLPRTPPQLPLRPVRPSPPLPFLPRRRLPCCCVRASVFVRHRHLRARPSPRQTCSPVGLRLLHRHRRRPGFASSRRNTARLTTSLPYTPHPLCSPRRPYPTAGTLRSTQSGIASRRCLPAITCSAAAHAVAVAIVAALNHLMHRTHCIATFARSPTAPWPGADELDRAIQTTRYIYST